MKQTSFLQKSKKWFLFFAFMLTGAASFAQEKVEVNGHDVGTWFKDHWMWVAGGVILLLLIIIASSGSSSRRRKQTTINRDINGNVKSVTTTEVEDV